MFAKCVLAFPFVGVFVGCCCFFCVCVCACACVCVCVCVCVCEQEAGVQLQDRLTESKKIIINKLLKKDGCYHSERR